MTLPRKNESVFRRIIAREFGPECAYGHLAAESIRQALLDLGKEEPWLSEATNVGDLSFPVADRASTGGSRSATGDPSPVASNLETA